MLTALVWRGWFQDKTEFHIQELRREAEILSELAASTPSMLASVLIEEQRPYSSSEHYSFEESSQITEPVSDWIGRRNLIGDLKLLRLRDDRRSVINQDPFISSMGAFDIAYPRVSTAQQIQLADYVPEMAEVVIRGLNGFSGDWSSIEERALKAFAPVKDESGNVIGIWQSEISADRLNEGFL